MYASQTYPHPLTAAAVENMRFAILDNYATRVLLWTVAAAFEVRSVSIADCRAFKSQSGAVVLSDALCITICTSNEKQLYAPDGA